MLSTVRLGGMTLRVGQEILEELGWSLPIPYLIPYYVHPWQVCPRPVSADRPLCRSPLVYCGSMPFIALCFRLIC